jgi:asparagine N-glycosylation enzyme membrane subunit Stt3
MWVEAVALRCDALAQKLPRLPSRWALVLSIIVLAAVASLLRSVHLFNSSYYYILSPDSHFFHWLAGRVMAGQGPPLDSTPDGLSIYSQHSGLAYPLAYIAKAMTSVIGISSADALALADKALPLVIAVISMVLIYLFAARIFNPRVGLLSAAAWVFMSYPIYIGSAGYLDRDGLSVLLFMVGAFLFYLAGIWHVKVWGRDVGWLIGGAGVLVVEALLYLEWNAAGVALLVLVIAVCCILRFVLGYADRIESEPDMRRRLVVSMRDVDWRPLALIIVADILVAALWAGLNFHGASFVYHTAGWIIGAGGVSTTQEEQGFSLGNLAVFQLFLIPMVFAFYLVWRKRAQSSIFFASWFLCLLLASLLTKRILIFASPAACLLSGVGLSFLWDSVKRVKWRRWGWVGMAALIVLGLSYSVGFARAEPSAYGVSPDREWQDALAYLKDETPKDSIVMSNWGWGYWILDLGQRRALVDNGYYGWDLERLRDVGLAYWTTDPEEAAQMMRKHGASYLVFTRLDQQVASVIMGWADVGEGLTSFPGNSLFMQTLSGEFQSGGGLEVVYRSPPEPNSSSRNEPEVVILGLSP